MRRVGGLMPLDGDGAAEIVEHLLVLVEERQARGEVLGLSGGDGGSVLAELLEIALEGFDAQAGLEGVAVGAHLAVKPAQEL